MRLMSVLLLVVAASLPAAAQDTNFATGPQYLVTAATMLLRPISTPSMSLDAPLPPVPSLPEVAPPVPQQPYVQNPALEHQADLFPIYYGYPRVSVVEVASPEQTPELPASLGNFQYADVSSPESLRELGYGMTLGEAASYWKAHKPHAPRVYTNADLHRSGF